MQIKQHFLGNANQNIKRLFFGHIKIELGANLPQGELQAPLREVASLPNLFGSLDHLFSHKCAF